MYFLFQKSLSAPSFYMLNLGIMYFCQELIKHTRPSVKCTILTLSWEGNSVFYVKHSSAFQLLFLNTAVTCMRNVRDHLLAGFICYIFL